MKRDHVCFALFLTLLFVAPEIPVGAVLKSHNTGLISVSPGFLGLLLWLTVSPRPVLKLGTRPSWGLLVVCFALYGWLISGFSGNGVSVLYASQYLFYSLFGFLVLRSYLSRAHACAELDKVFAIVIISGVVYSVGALISAFIGPIYPHQTHWTARLVQGFTIQRGVGFAENPNGAGGVLAFFLAATMLLYPPSWRYQRAAVAITGAGLLATFSRSAILSFAVSYIALTAIGFLRAMLAQRVSRRLVRRVAILLVCLLLGFVLFSTSGMILESGLMRSLLLGLGFADGQLIHEDIATRLELWDWGVRSWLARGELAMLFGVGFHNSTVLNQYGVWTTAHNFYVCALNEFGVVGLLMIVCAFLGATTKALMRLIAVPKELRVYSFGFLALSALAIHNMTEVFLYSPKYVTLLLFSVLLIDVTRSRSATWHQQKTETGTGRMFSPGLARKRAQLVPEAEWYCKAGTCPHGPWVP